MSDANEDVEMAEGNASPDIAAMKEKDVKRIAVVTSIGAGDSENQAPFFFKVSFFLFCAFSVVPILSHCDREKLRSHLVCLPSLYRSSCGQP